MSGQSNIDDVRARIMALESANVFDKRAWQMVLADLTAQERPSALADAERRMATAKQNSQWIGGVDQASADGERTVKLLVDYPGGRKTWLVNGREVTTWSDYDRCLRCGHKLRSPISRARGYGQECEAKKVWNAGPVAKIFVSAETEVPA